LDAMAKSAAAWYRRLCPPTPPGIMVPHSDRAYPNRITDA
jgi:putative transposase